MNLHLLNKWRTRCDGGTAIEYALIMAAVALVIFGFVFAFGEDLSGLIGGMSDQVGSR